MARRRPCPCLCAAKAPPAPNRRGRLQNPWLNRFWKHPALISNRWSLCLTWDRTHCISSCPTPRAGIVWMAARSMFGGPLAQRSRFYRVGSSVFASSLEACFLQMATLLPFADLVRVGFELCGRYALSSRDPRGFETRAMPLTTCVALRGYVDKARGMRGSKKARQALAFVAEGSASPMETALAMLLCLPRAQGGYGLPLPLLNHEVVLRSARKTAWKKTYCCDLFWPEGSLAVEYDSDMFHTGSKRIAHDSKRRNALLSAGIAVVTVTTAQIKDAREIDEIAVVLSQALGRRARTSMKGLMTRRHELRRLFVLARVAPQP